MRIVWLDCIVQCTECHCGFSSYWLPLSQWVSGSVSMELGGEYSVFCGGALGTAFLPLAPQEAGGSPQPAGTWPSALGSGIRSQGDFWGPAHPDNSLLSHYLPTLTCQQHSQFYWIFSFYSETFTFYVFKSFYLYYFSLKLARMTVLFKFSIIWKTFSPPENYFCVTV